MYLITLLTLKFIVSSIYIILNKFTFSYKKETLLSREEESNN